MNLTDLLRLFRRYRVVAIVVVIVVLAIGAFAAFTPSNKYQSTATVLVEPQVAGGQAVPVSLIDFLVPSYLARLDTTRFQAQASADLPPSIRRAPVSISSTAAAGTGIININVSSTQQDAVAPWAKAMAQNLIDTTNGDFTTLTLLDDPLPPSAPYAPSRLLILALSVVIALFAAIISVIIASSFRARGDGAAEIRERFGARVLAEIPNLSRALAASDPAALAVNRKAFDAIDALQSLRANLSYLLVDRAEPWLVVTSAAKREGKSFISVHLSWLLGSLGQRTLLLDADGRQSTAHTMLGLSVSPGIGDLTESNLRSITQPTANENLVFIGPGIPDRHPAELASALSPQPARAGRRRRSHARRRRPADARCRGDHRVRRGMRCGAARHRRPPAGVRRRRADDHGVERPEGRGARRGDQPGAAAASVSERRERLRGGRRRHVSSANVASPRVS